MTKESVTKTVESGAFIRTVVRTGKKRRQKTQRFKKSQKKVILGHIGDFEVYVYPYDYGDCIFIGKFPVSTYINKTNYKALFGLFNRMRWYLNGEWQIKPKNEKGRKTLRDNIASAYIHAQEEQQSKEMEGKTL